VYVALAGGVLHAFLIPAAAPFFAFTGHAPLVQRYEVIYYQVLCAGAFPAIASSAFSGFFTGLGRPWPVMWINVLSTAVNLVLDYLMIFGKWGFPEMGIRGAAVATVISGTVNCASYLVLLYRRKYRSEYATIRGWRLDRELFARLIRFGLPSGVQFFVDIAGFTIFILLVGRLGTASLAATNIAFNINTLAFMPMIGFGIAVSVLVGQYLGREKPGLGERSVYSGFHLTFIYMTAIAALYLFTPELFIDPFMSGSDSALMGEIRQAAVILLRFVAVYSVFDTLNIIFASALKGAGDTKYVMYMLAGVSLLVLVIPAYIAIVLLKEGLMAAWFIASAYVIVLGFSFLLRFLAGKWKSMKVIEECVACLPPTMPEAPVAPE
jgi:MATE family multidrug resistance protein